MNKGVVEMDKKEMIIRTAIKLFVKQGFENTPTSQISKESGVATGTLFHHFKTKEDLINAAYLFVKKLAMDWYSPPDSKLSIKEQIRLTWRAGIEFGFKHRDEMEFLNKFSNSAYITKLSREEGQSIMEPLAVIFEQGIKKGVLKRLDKMVIVYTYYGIFQAFLNSIIAVNRLDDRIISEGFTVLWDALKK